MYACTDNEVTAVLLYECDGFDSLQKQNNEHELLSTLNLCSPSATRKRRGPLAKQGHLILPTLYRLILRGSSVSTGVLIIVL